VTATLSRDEDVRVAFAADASGLYLVPDAVARPSCAAEVAEIVREASSTRTPITAVGAQTSTTAASISDEGIILSLRGMDRVLEVDPERRTVRVEPGALVGDVKRAALADGLLFPPDPTGEEWSTIGGAIACNASGARSLRYGATRPYVAALKVVLASGELVELRRPQLEKNTAGYALAHDPVDWFVGSEGTLGVVVEAELSLLTLPRRVVGLGIPFASEAAALAFVVAARESALVRARCLEFFDEQALAIARAEEAGGGWASGARAFVYAEDAGTTADVDAEAPLDEWLALAERHDAIADDVRVFDGEASLRAARAMRHAVPARMNERGTAFRASGGRKVSTDWAVPYRQLAAAIDVARGLADRHGVEQAVIYGHAGNGHPHQNFIARDASEVARIEGVVEETLRHVLSVGGTVAAEHGIGKLKRRWLPLQLTPLQLSAMRALKRELDPRGILAPGNVL
jgi:FAD/FMN-containing dehydrogenase